MGRSHRGVEVLVAGKQPAGGGGSKLADNRRRTGRSPYRGLLSLKPTNPPPSDQERDRLSEGRSTRRLTATVTDLEVARQKAFLVSAYFDSRNGTGEIERSLAELALLTDTAGSTPVATVAVRRPAPQAATLIGQGKAEELAHQARALDVDVVVFDNDLTPGQQRNLQQLFKCDVVDRVAVILDIFAQHATSREGMLQVELALLRYQLPRLRGKGTELSRLGGGIGTRGPGETKLETDRRRIMQRISSVQKRLEQVHRVRETQRKNRQAASTTLLSLVGYTNAGKSTLLNALTNAGVLTEDRLFSTLDSTTRRLGLPNGRQVLVSDTVGFVQRLPHQLVEAFRSTLQETARADLLLHVVDVSEPGVLSRIEAVQEVLDTIGSGHVPELMVFNKIDQAAEDIVRRFRRLYPEAALVSAAEAVGLDDLLLQITRQISSGFSDLELLVPYPQGAVLGELHREAEILSESYNEQGTLVKARVPPDLVSRYRQYLITETVKPTDL
ncbi:MAG: GTPase HflX [Acidimicrobiia bacterium]|nr:GTPase HflX [Acidimicrobiia bacterium]MYD03570.1 GTPase HflX [Acidimicrobiia bacterium]MYH54972.1 GTPase HflX [Acidimicrobiia bacterium]